MKFADDAWAFYKDKFGVPDDERARIEQEMTDEHAMFLRIAGGDEELALGLMTLNTVANVARDFGLPQPFVLESLRQRVPNKERWRRALSKAHTYLRGH